MKKLFSIFLLAVCCATVYGQSIEQQYKNADNYVTKYNSLFYGGDVNPQWIGDSNKFWYSELTPKGRDYYLFDAEKKTKKDLLNFSKIISALSKELSIDIKPKGFKITALEVDSDMKSFEFDYKNYDVTISFDGYKITNIKKKEYKNEPLKLRVKGAHKSDGVTISPDKKYEAYILEGNLFVKNLKDNSVKKLSETGSFSGYYSCYIHWSPDSKKIATTKYSPVEYRQLYMVESTPSFQFQPHLYNMDYVKPGDALPMNHPVLFDVESGEKTAIEVPNVMSQYELGNFQWADDSESFTFDFNKRGHQQFIIYRVDVQDGKADVLVNEESDTFVYYNENYYRHLDSRDEVLWVSQRDGWRHLYLYDYKTGEVKRQLTKGEWIVRSIVAVDEEAGEAIITVKGKQEGIDPYLTQYYLVNLESGKLTNLTPEEGNHVAKVSSDFKYLIDTWSKVNVAPKTILRSAKTGKKIADVSKADISEMIKEGYVMPEPFVAKGRDGKTDIWGVIIRPDNFDAKKKYPVIEYIYAGPHNSFVPKSFIPLGIANLTELGFIVVQIDGMGTFNRSKAFHDITWRNLKDSGFPDRILWMESAAKEFPEMDISNVGIYGASSGGQSVGSAMLLYGDFYKVGYASSGCYDNRMDKIWWNEQWMGYPIGEWYAENAAITHVKNLTGKLMLVNGELDSNVDPSSTFQLVDALINAGKEFELVILPSVGHTLGENYGERKRRDFFVKHIMKKETPNWNKIK